MVKLDPFLPMIYCVPETGDWPGLGGLLLDAGSGGGGAMLCSGSMLDQTVGYVSQTQDLACRLFRARVPALHPLCLLVFEFLRLSQKARDV